MNRLRAAWRHLFDRGTVKLCNLAGVDHGEPASNVFLQLGAKLEELRGKELRVTLERLVLLLEAHAEVRAEDRAEVDSIIKSLRGGGGGGGGTGSTTT